ncbi:MAG TPA: hypothetical protein VJ501_15175 [Burkholderiaceae bacterium]|nr:hypothetical protein [Burkholderiaceae bacterium]
MHTDIGNRSDGGFDLALRGQGTLSQHVQVGPGNAINNAVADDGTPGA